MQPTFKCSAGDDKVFLTFMAQWGQNNYAYEAMLHQSK